MKDSDDLFGAGSGGLVPRGDAARQAIDSLRGYAYQVTAAALAWLDLGDQSRLFLEVAEDYAIVASNAIQAIQVKDTESSGTVTLNTGSVRDAIAAFINLKTSNPGADIELRYFTTSEIGTERATGDRPGDTSGLVYWRKAAAGADIGPLRTILESGKFSEAVTSFVKKSDDEALRGGLLQRIHWDCGKPDISTLRRELEERLVVLGRDLFRLPAQETTRVAEALIYRVLETSIGGNSVDRVLTRADLYRTVDKATRLSVPRAAVDAMAMFSSGLVTAALTQFGTSLPVAVSEPVWFIDGSTLAQPKRTIPRNAVEADVASRMRQFGAAVIVGASGLGKSSVARAVARSFAGNFLLVDFRRADADETRSRLDGTLARIGGVHAPLVILEDLNFFNDALVAPSLARLTEAMRRRDRVLLVTCYVPPTARALLNINLDVNCLIDCPYFTEEEAGNLVAIYDGNVEIWRRLAYVAGAFGHPQLVHAFVAGMSARNWPQALLLDIVGNGFSTGDVNAEREASRRTLVLELPENARNLLYRLSLTVGRFDRTMALAVANTPPPIAQAGECLDALVGPWLETVGRDTYRVSPLASRSGQGTMSQPEQANVHRAIASQFLANGTINGNDADVIMLHAMLGKNEQVLFVLSHSVLTSNEHVTSLLADNLTTFKLLRTDTPPYPDNSAISGILRLAQFKVLVARRETDKIGDCAVSLLSEVEQMADQELRQAFRAISLATILGTMGIANFLDNWLDALQNFQAMTDADGYLSGLRDNYEDNDEGDSDLIGTLFAIGSAGLFTVARLEAIINQLDGVDTALRLTYLNAISEDFPDFSVFVNGAWTEEHKHNTLNPNEATERYRRMAILTSPWQIRPLTVQCWVAQSVMLDEYAHDADAALKVLDEAVETLGDDVLLSRARAKIYWRGQNHPAALKILRGIADKVGLHSHVERAFALREAAISSAQCNDWAQAETWFLESKGAATQSDLPDMTVMAIGLDADAAVAALQLGEERRALSGLCGALIALSNLGSNTSLRAMYCHQVVRHAVLWARSRIENSRVDIEGAPITIVPGCCSNPEPAEAVTKRPLGSLDIAWYTLADAEVSSGVDAGIVEHLYGRLAGGPIPVMEFELRLRRVWRDIANSNPGKFARHLWSYVEVLSYISQRKQQVMESFNVLAPTREDIPSLSRSNYFEGQIAEIATDAVFAYAIAAACRQSVESLSELEAALEAEFGNNFPGVTLLRRVNSTVQVTAPSTFAEHLLDAVSWFKSGDHSTPRVYCSAGIRFLQQTNSSGFKRLLIPTVAAWQRNAWTRIVVSETFRLRSPLQTVPPIQRALTTKEDDARFLARLFLAAVDAVGLTLPRDMISEFRALDPNPVEP